MSVNRAAPYLHPPAPLPRPTTAAAAAQVDQLEESERARMAQRAVLLAARQPYRPLTALVRVAGGGYLTPVLALLA